MAKLILKSPYIKNSGKAGGYLEYIGTREGVELLPVSGYLEYMGKRPRSHGLFGDENHIDLDKAMEEVKECPGNIWTHIISLKREDATRLGYDRADVWKHLLRTHRNEIAEAMHIPPKDFRWYAAFHDEGDHPHVHMMAWSVVPDQAYLSQDGIRKIKSTLTNQIFQQEMVHIYEQKSVSRDELVRQAKDTVVELCREMRQGIQSHPVVEEMMEELSMELGEVTGKKTYGYLPKKLKKQVDEIVNEMEKLPVVSECYDRWLDLQWQVESYYRDKPRERKPLSEQKEFRSIKNAVIQQVEQIRLGTVTFEDRGMKRLEKLEEDNRRAYGEYWELRDRIEDDTIPLAERDAAARRTEELAEKGDQYAQHLMGQLYRDGPLLIPDAVNAYYWFNRAAKQGSVSAQYDLGKLLLSDDREVRNAEDGIRWLEQAAESGHSFATYRLGKEYLKGRNAERDPVKAVDYFTRSAEQGNPYAQYMLGKLCLMGQGMKQSTEQALYWFERAAMQGHPHAQYFLDRQDDLKPPSVMLVATRLLYHMSRIFENTAPVEDSTSMGIQIDRKRLEELQEKRIAMGHKPDDHVDERQYIGPTMSTPW